MNPGISTKQDEVMRGGVGDRIAGLERELERYKKAVEVAKAALMAVTMSKDCGDFAEITLEDINSILNP